MESVRQKSGSCICISDRERVEGWTEEKVRQLLDAYLLEHSDLNLELQQAEIYINDNER
ncbi:MAG: hypothetical protein Q4D90_11360 [bacterium]|nr:hypothetical protein [bacterium]